MLASTHGPTPSLFAALFGRPPLDHALILYSVLSARELTESGEVSYVIELFPRYIGLIFGIDETAVIERLRALRDYLEPPSDDDRELAPRLYRLRGLDRYREGLLAHCRKARARDATRRHRARARAAGASS